MKSREAAAAEAAQARVFRGGRRHRFGATVRKRAAGSRPDGLRTGAWAGQRMPLSAVATTAVLAPAAAWGGVARPWRLGPLRDGAASAAGAGACLLCLGPTLMSARGFAGDLIAGLTLWAILVPQALCVRQHRGRVADCRPLRGAGRAPALRCRGQFEGARRRADGGDRGAVGGHGSGPCPGRGWPGSPRSPAALALTAGVAALGCRACCASGSWRTSSASRCSRASSSGYRFHGDHR